MRLLIAITCLCLFSCGQNPADSFVVDMSNTKSVWKGSLDADPLMLEVFNEASVCLSSFGFQRSGYPSVVITEHGFYCNGRFTDGCADFSSGTIFIIDERSCNSLISAPGYQCYPQLLKHEVIHWITQIGDDAHETDFMTKCEA